MADQAVVCSDIRSPVTGAPSDRNPWTEATVSVNSSRANFEASTEVAAIAVSGVQPLHVPHSTDASADPKMIGSVRNLRTDSVTTDSSNLVRHSWDPEVWAPASQRSSLGDSNRLPLHEVRRQAAGIRLLSVCGGPARETDGLEKYVQDLGAQVDVFDLVRSPRHDLTDDTCWRSIRDDIESGVYAGAACASPCSTFCPNRGFGSGPGVLRGEHPPGVCGLKGLKPEDQQSVRVNTYIALRCIEAARLFRTLELP